MLQLVLAPATPAVLLVCFVLLSSFSPSQGSGFPDCIPHLCISCTDLVWKEPGSKLQIGKTPRTFGFLQTSSPWNLFLHSPEVPALAAQESPKPAGSNPYLTAWSLRMLTPGPSPSSHHSLASLPVGSSPGVLPPFCTSVGRGLDAGLCAQGCCSSPCAVDPSQAVPRAACPQTGAVSSCLSLHTRAESAPSLHWAQGLGTSSGTASRRPACSISWAWFFITPILEASSFKTRWLSVLPLRLEKGACYTGCDPEPHRDSLPAWDQHLTPEPSSALPHNPLCNAAYQHQKKDFTSSLCV